MTSTGNSVGISRSEMNPNPDLQELLGRLRRTFADFGQDPLGTINPDGPEAADAIEALLADLARKDAALREFIDSIERAPISWETGVCCCGSPVEGHGFGDGHSPVDEGSYFVSNAIAAARQALETKAGGAS